MIDQLSWLTRTARICFPGNSHKALRLQARMVSSGLRHADLVQRFRTPAPGSALELLMQGRPEILGALVWPYQCASWSAHVRLTRIFSHCEEIDRLGAPLKFHPRDKLMLHDLGAHHEGMRIVIDQPKWFLREGGLTLNIFLGTFRSMSLAFSFFRTPENRLQVFIGSIQGRNTEDSLEIYRTLTKVMAGLRPRDLLLEYLRFLCAHFGVQDLFAVANAQRHQRHPYFGQKEFQVNYDQIWLDRGGIPESQDCFRLPLEAERRPIDEIKPNKRSLYRKRYALLDDLRAGFDAGLSQAVPCEFADT
jgi:uncharacterized protein VirK/YbjX